MSLPTPSHPPTRPTNHESSRGPRTLQEHIAAVRTTFIEALVAGRTRFITHIKRQHEEACFHITMVRLGLVRAGYNFKTHAPREGVVMIAQMERGGMELGRYLPTIVGCRESMAKAHCERGEFPWEERNDVEWDGVAREARRRCWGAGEKVSELEEANAGAEGLERW